MSAPPTARVRPPGRPRFTVVVPTYNRRALLEAALRSVARQEFDAYEIVVVDDGSDDGTLEMIDRLGFPVRVVTQKNRGPGAARNAGAAEAKGEYLAFLDSDDLWFPWTLAAYRDVADRFGAPAFIAGMPLTFEAEGELGGAKAGPVAAEFFPDYFASHDRWRWWGASSFVVRRDWYERVGGFTCERVNGEDADLALRLGVAPGFARVTSPPTFGYRRHPGSAVGDLARTIDGARLKVRAEKRGGYPGGAARRRERRVILSRHVRPVVLAGLRSGRVPDGLALYRATFFWNLGERRWRFLLGALALALPGLLRTRPARRAPVTST